MIGINRFANDDVRKAVDLAYSDKQRVYQTIKLPCCGASVELGSPKDQYVQCPKCQSRHLITWGATKTITSEDAHDFRPNCACSHCIARYSSV